MSAYATNEFSTSDVEVEHRRDLILIESMVRDGRSEGEIVAAVLDRHDDGAEPGQSLPSPS